ncbi:GMC oxidoreductase-domain-containing protein [Lentinula novae-zelandiae]|nr:GMC oxidoreductase-domain-containing protein [Lentinula novae-zelandiae]
MSDLERFSLGGTTVAARLAENYEVTVLLVEAGSDNRTDKIVYDIYAYSQAFGTDLDWAWPTDQGKTMRGGKTLGGSTSINGAHYTRGMQAQYDAWTTLLETSAADADWDWEGILGYMQKSEAFSAPNSQQAAKGAESVADYHGLSGPVQVTYPDAMYGGPEQPDFINSIVNLTGIEHCPDVNGGGSNCVLMTPLTIDWHDSDHRSSSCQAYLTPVESQRTNWLTLTEHLVRISVKRTASGIEFAPSSGGSTRYAATALKEIIVAAGAIQSPALLQLSGIGDSSLLNSLDIGTNLDMKGVGRNLQEQTMNSLGAGGNFDYGGEGPSDCIAYPNIHQVFGWNKIALQVAVDQLNDSSVRSNWAVSQSASADSQAALEKNYEVQAGLILNGNAPIVELFYDTGYPELTYIGIDLWQLLPFSRGNVSITTTDPFTRPAVNVNYFGVGWDLDVQVASARLAHRIIASPTLSSLSTGETVPGTRVVPNTNGNFGSDQDWKSWISDPSVGFSAVNHAIGTAPMMRQELGGVVDAHAHLSATLYGVAEKAADIIRASN